jgi:hypothetical protein
MAEGQNNTTQSKTELFSKGMTKDLDNLMHPESSWTHARNAVNNSQRGEIGVIGNEPSNRNCITAPYTIIGFIHLFADKWIVFSTDNANSEIGLFDEDSCRYRVIVNDPCLELSTYNLITGQSKENFDCTWQIYWQDNLNPDRTLNIGDPNSWLENYVSNNYYDNNQLWPGVAWKENCGTVNSCLICTPTNELDCDKIRLARLISYPCIELSQGPTSGSLLNGSYQVAISYTVNQQKVTDYFVGSETQPLFQHEDAASSLEIKFSNLDDVTFDEFELVVIKTINMQTVAKQVGFYSTKTTVVNIDILSEELISVPIELLNLNTPVFDRSAGIFRVNDYLIRTAPTTKFNFNYQPLANLIQTGWVSVQYPEKYYKDHGNNVGYMRDEVYAFFIRWVYDTGDVSPSFHIPGRLSVSTDFQPDSSDDSKVDTENGIPNEAWRGLDTSTFSTSSGTLEDGGKIIARGRMSYWQSSEKYPDDKSEIWNSSAHSWTNVSSTDYDLCGKFIRHHKMPSTEKSKHFSKVGDDLFINILGVEFSNIKPPRDNNGNLIPNITGYEILRANREGNKTILAKGIINNMGLYEIKGPNNIKENKIGLYQNYPYNDVTPDPFLTSYDILTEPYKDGKADDELFSTFAQTHFTFHSPDTTFKKPFLSASELRCYNIYEGSVNGSFLPVENHPQHKFITDITFVSSLILGVGTAIATMRAKIKVKYEGGTLDYSGLNAAGIAGQVLLSGTWNAATLAYYETVNAPLTFLASLLPGGSTTLEVAQATYGTATALASAGGVTALKLEYEDTNYTSLPSILRDVMGIPIFVQYTSQFTEEYLTLIRNLCKYDQFAYRIQSHGLYDKVKQDSPVGFRRRQLDNARYLSDNIQDVDNQHRVNNLFRNKTVYLNTKYSLGTLVGEKTRYTQLELGLTNKKDKNFENKITLTTYAALKLRLVNQYGQLQSLKQIKITNCVIDKNTSKTPVLFGGDVYINRYTEKNTFFYFIIGYLNNLMVLNMIIEILQ